MSTDMAQAYRDEGLELRRQAAADRKAASADLEKARLERGAAAHDRKEIAQIEASIA